MKKRYQIKSERYNYTHSFVQVSNDIYAYVPEKEWMPIYINGEGLNVFVDTEGGPCIGKGWSNNEVEVTEIVRDENNNVLFRLKNK